MTLITGRKKRSYYPYECRRKSSFFQKNTQKELEIERTAIHKISPHPNPQMNCMGRLWFRCNLGIKNINMLFVAVHTSS